jgi:hypothetical protein
LETTRLSTKGQIVLSKAMRPAENFPEAELDKVAGCLRTKHKSKTLAQMEAAIRREVIRRHGGASC